MACIAVETLVAGLRRRALQAADLDKERLLASGPEAKLQYNRGTIIRQLRSKNTSLDVT